ncbi:MAG: hypothetical protein QOH62_2311 [Solirubrobacteraceae bacterium]|jgi:hypothetical protein|nr:hypothetical protein [Solirubrobacteraceae bacterium]
MARKQSDDLFDVLRRHGLRKRVAKTIAELDGGGRRVGSKGEKLARRAVDDLTAAAEDIRTRVLTRDDRTEAARKTASARKRAAARRSAAAKKGPHIRARAR